MQQYSDREAWSFYRQYNELPVYFEADLNTSKNLDPDYWQKHYRMCRETFDYICSLVHDYMVKNDTKKRKKERKKEKKSERKKKASEAL